MRRMRRFVVLVIVVWLAACSRATLVPRVGPGPLATTELVNRSELIFVGSINSFKFSEPIHAHIPLFPQLDECMVPVRVSVTVENVLQGSIRRGPLEYYFFGSVCSTMGPVENPSVNPRSIFFLRRESGTWRVTEDYWKNRLWIFSGRHSDDLIRGKNVAEAIPLILLTPGDNFSPEDFASLGLVWATGPSMELVGEEATHSLIRPLLTHPDLYLRCKVCTMLAPEADKWDCAGPVLDAVLNRLSTGEAGWLKPDLLTDIQMLTDHADREVRQRVTRMIPGIRLHIGPLPKLPPATTTGLR